MTLQTLRASECWLRPQLAEASFVSAAIDCSTKSRIREIPRCKQVGAPLPQPLRSEAAPLGVSGLRGADLERVQRDNAATDFLLD